ncbi:MAG: UPF0280 family protein [Bacteroidetes bacterium]|nr:UPF0280 family protein [Bacteroidota bacterium]
MYQERLYRKIQNTERFHYFQVIVEESDLWIGVTPHLYFDDLPKIITNYLSKLRAEIENAINKHPKFHYSHLPIGFMRNYGQIVERMSIASINANVGPMAAVAGAVSEMVGEKLMSIIPKSEIIIENGGDIWAKFHNPITISIEAGDSSFSGKTAFTVNPNLSPCGICSSSGKIGHSLSYGKADNVTIICKSAALADAWATSLCNMVTDFSGLDIANKIAGSSADILGFIAIFEDSMLAGGDIEITSLKSSVYEI